MKPGRIVPSAAAVIAFVLVMAAAVLSAIQTHDVLDLPAAADAIDPHITVEGHPLRPHRGQLYITFVEEQPDINLLTKLFEQTFNPDATIVPPVDIYGTSAPTKQQEQQAQQQSVVEMRDSKSSAEIAAFRALGYPTPYSEQVAVLNVLDTSKARGKLQADDVILVANGQTIGSADQLIRTVQALHPGAPISLLVSRGAPHAHTFRLTVPTIRTSAGKAAIGIHTKTIIDARPPYKVTIDSQDIQGPSAGLMFALALINRVSRTDLTHGYKIAGTGEILPSGLVGPIGGVKQKVIGARRVGARYFFVPAYCDRYTCNYKEAQPYAKGITLVKVNTLQEALNFLRRLR